jgi:hypothetical protein
VLQEARSSAIFRSHSGVRHRVVLGPGCPARETVEVGHPDPFEPPNHLEIARCPELVAEAGQLGDLGVAGSIGGENREHVRTDPGAPMGVIGGVLAGISGLRATMWSPPSEH